MYLTGPWEVIQRLNLEEDLLRFTDAKPTDGPGKYLIKGLIGLRLIQQPKLRLSGIEEVIVRKALNFTH